MSGCGGNCNCGSICSCKGCNCKRDADLQFEEKSAGSPILLLTNSGSSDMGFMEGMIVAGENEGCKCGSNCTCDPCNCK